MTFETPTQLAEHVAASLPEEKSRELLQRIKEAPTESEIVTAVQESLADLREEERIHIDENLRDLSLRTSTEQRDVLREFITQLQMNLERKEIAAAEPLPEPAPVAPQPVREAPLTSGKKEKAKGFLTKENAVALGIAGLFAFIATTAALLWRGTKKSAEEAGKKVKSLYERFKTGVRWIVGTSLVFAGVFLGVKAAQKWGEIMNLKNNIERLGRELATLPAEMRAAAEQQLNEEKKQFRALQEGVKKDGDLSKLPEKIVPKDDLGKAVQQARDTGEILLYSQLAKGILAFHPAKGVETVHLEDLLYLNRDVAMSDVFQGKLRYPSSDLPKREKAKSFLMKLCQEGKRYSQQPAGAENTLTLKKYLEAVAGGYVASSEMLDMAKEVAGDPAQLMEKLDRGKLLELVGHDGGMHREWQSLLRERVSADVSALEGMSLLSVLNTVASLGEISISAYLEDRTERKDPTEQRLHEALRQVATVIKKDEDLARFVLPFFHGVFVEEREEGQTNLDHVRVLLTDRIPFHLALRLYLYWRTALQGNPAGVVLAQVEVLRRIYEKDTRTQAKVNLHRAAQYAITTFSEKSAEELAEQWKLTEDQRRKIAVAFSKSKQIVVLLVKKGAISALEAAAAGAVQGYGATEANIRNWPWYWGAGVPVGEEFVRAGYHWRSNPYRLKLRLDEYRGDIGSMKPESIREVGRRAVLQPPKAAVNNAQARFDKIYEKVGLSPHTDDLTYSLRQCCRSAQSRKSWEAFRDLATARGESDLAKLADDFVKNKDMRKAFEIQQHRILHRVPGRHVIGGIQEWGSASPFRRLVRMGGAGLHAYAVYADVHEIDEREQQMDEMQQYARDVLQDMEIQLVNNSAFERTEEGEYRHRDSGVTISLKEATENLGASLSPLAIDRIRAQKLRAATSGGGLALTLLIGPRLFAGPVGIAMVAGEAVIRIGINAWEQGKVRKFINDCPPWMLAALGTQDATGISEYDMLTKASSWMLSDAFSQRGKKILAVSSPALGLLAEATGMETTPEDKPKIRQKMLFAIFCHDLQKYVPEIFQEITGGMPAPFILDEFYTTDFQNIILPFFYVRLFQRAKSDAVSWDSFQEGKIDSGLIVIPPDVTLVQIREAMRESAVLYLQHLREKRFLDSLALAKEQAEEGGVDEELIQALDGFASLKVFGRPLGDVSLEEIGQNGGRTRAEMLMEKLRTRVNVAPGETRQQKLSAVPDLFVVKGRDVPGSDFQSMDFGREEMIYDFVEDPVLRQKLKQAFPETIEEPEAAPYPSVQEWRSAEAWKKWLDPLPGGLGREERLDRARAVVNNVLNEVGKQAPVVASLDALDRSLTEGSRELFEREEGRPSYSRDENLRKRLYGTVPTVPLVFSALSPRINVSSDYERLLLRCQDLKYPNASDGAFALENARAVFFAGRMSKSAHPIVLATFVYGDLGGENEKMPQWYVLQQAGSETELGRNSSERRGMGLAMNAQAFQKQVGTQSMIEKARTEWEGERPKREKYLAEQKRRENEERIKEQNEREQRRLEDQRERSEARRKAKEQPGVLQKDPEGRWYVGHHPEHGFIYISPPHVSTGPSISAAPRMGEKPPSDLKTVVEYNGKRHTLTPNYIVEAEQKREVHSDVLTQALIMPIPGNPAGSIDKVLAVFVKDVGSRDVGEMARALLPLYERLQTDGEQRRFLGELRTLIYQATRDEKRPDRDARYLTKERFRKEVLSKLSSYGESGNRKAA